jgi:hypothetical protein
VRRLKVGSNWDFSCSAPSYRLPFIASGLTLTETGRAGRRGGSSLPQDIRG